MGGRIVIADFLLVIIFDIIASYFPIVNVIRVCSLVREILVYNLFYLAGFLLYKNISKKGICFIFILGVIFFFCVRPFYSHDMQIDKFPPNLYFLAFNICSLSLLALVFSYVHLPKIKIIDTWNRNGYGIYIYQSFYYCLWMVVNIMLDRIFNFRMSPFLYMITSVCFMLLSGSIVGKLLSYKKVRVFFA